MTVGAGKPLFCDLSSPPRSATATTERFTGNGGRGRVGRSRVEDVAWVLHTLGSASGSSTPWCQLVFHTIFHTTAWQRQWVTSSGSSTPHCALLPHLAHSQRQAVRRSGASEQAPNGRQTRQRLQNRTGAKRAPNKAAAAKPHPERHGRHPVRRPRR